MNSKFGTVTAIVSAYYAEPFLEGRIQNLLEQSLQPKIVIVCQKNSPELAIARKALVLGEIEIVLTPDIPTVYKAWNIGLEHADTDYVTNANSDDRHYPGAIEELAKTLRNNSSFAVAYADVHRVKEVDGEPFGAFEWLEGGFDELMHKGCFVGPMPMWRRSLHAKHGNFAEEFKSAGDYEFWLRIAKAGEKFRHVKTVLGAHLERDDAIEHRQPVLGVIETARARAKYR